MSIFES